MKNTKRRIEPLSFFNHTGISRHLEKMAAKLGPDKLMFSSDMPQNTPAELAVFRAVFPDENDLDKVLAGTALRVFDIQP